MAEQIVYWTLNDGTDAWYVYPNSDGELVITDTEPTDETGIFEDYVYVQRDDSDIILTADSGIIYAKLTESDDTAWYIYPNSDGELIITDTEPS